MNDRVLRLLVDSGKATEAQVAAAREAAGMAGILSSRLIEVGVDGDAVLSAQSEVFGLPIASRAALIEAARAPPVGIIPVDVCGRMAAAPFGASDGKVLIAFADPRIVDQARRVPGFPDHVAYVADEQSIREVIAALKRPGSSAHERPPAAPPAPRQVDPPARRASGRVDAGGGPATRRDRESSEPRAARTLRSGSSDAPSRVAAGAIALCIGAAGYFAGQARAPQAPVEMDSVEAVTKYLDQWKFHEAAAVASRLLDTTSDHRTQRELLRLRVQAYSALARQASEQARTDAQRLGAIEAPETAAVPSAGGGEK